MPKRMLEGLVFSNSRAPELLRAEGRITVVTAGCLHCWWVIMPFSRIVAWLRDRVLAEEHLALNFLSATNSLGHLGSLPLFHPQLQPTIQENND